MEKKLKKVWVNVTFHSNSLSSTFQCTRTAAPGPPKLKTESKTCKLDKKLKKKFGGTNRHTKRKKKYLHWTNQTTKKKEEKTFEKNKKNLQSSCTRNKKEKHACRPLEGSTISRLLKKKTKWRHITTIRIKIRRNPCIQEKHIISTHLKRKIANRTVPASIKPHLDPQPPKLPRFYRIFPTI